MTKLPSNKIRNQLRLPTLLYRLAKTHPKTAAHLSQAQSNLKERLSQYLGGARLQGYEELIDHLEKLEPVFKKSRKLRGISFLIVRGREDFQTALAATLSGFHSLVHDAMRDVMEIEFLLRDFYHEPQHIQQWLECIPKERNNRFRPAILRQRHAARLGKQPQNLGEASDYQAHSMFLHVSPYHNPFGGPGLIESTLPFARDMCFWEIFEHGRRLLLAAHRLRRKVASHIKSPRDQQRGLRHFRDAWHRTQEMQSIWSALLEAPHAGSRDGNTSGWLNYADLLNDSKPSYFRNAAVRQLRAMSELQWQELVKRTMSQLTAEGKLSKPLEQMTRTEFENAVYPIIFQELVLRSERE